MTTTVTITAPMDPAIKVEVRRSRETPRGPESEYIAELGANESLTAYVWLGGGTLEISERRVTPSRDLEQSR